MTASRHLFMAVAAALASSFCATGYAKEPEERLLATGQTTCWDTGGAAIPCAGTGQDADIKAGTPLSYADNGDGTITDNATGLMWEKQSFDGSIHDMYAKFKWDEAFAHVAELNKQKFAGHDDWRLPNLREMESLLNLQATEPPVSAEFNNNCVRGTTVLTGSCTASGIYWTSTSFAPRPHFAWSVVFVSGEVENADKRRTDHVRAVRGGR